MFQEGPRSAPPTGVSISSSGFSADVLCSRKRGQPQNHTSAITPQQRHPQACRSEEACCSLHVASAHQCTDKPRSCTWLSGWAAAKRGVGRPS